MLMIDIHTAFLSFFWRYKAFVKSANRLRFDPVDRINSDTPINLLLLILLLTHENAWTFNIIDYY